MQFDFLPSELEKVKAVKKEHEECSKTYAGAAGGHWTYIFSPNSIGQVAVVRCNICKKEEDVTDYDRW